MIVLPEEFEPTRWPGYFWNTSNKKLYSCKSGVLKALKQYPGNSYFPLPHYQVSINGKSKTACVYELLRIKPSAVRVKFPVQEEFKF